MNEWIKSLLRTTGVVVREPAQWRSSLVWDALAVAGCVGPFHQVRLKRRYMRVISKEKPFKLRPRSGNVKVYCKRECVTGLMCLASQTMNAKASLLDMFIPPECSVITF